MCFELLAIGLSIAGSFMQANAQASIAAQQAKIQQQQLKVEMENERIKALQETNDRLDEWMRAEATNRAAIAASGVGQNISYDQGISVYNKKVAARDVGRSQFNAEQRIGRARYEIKVAKWKAKATAQSAYTTAFADSLGAIGSALG